MGEKNLLVFELQYYSDAYKYCWVGKLQEICQRRETRGSHQQDREKKNHQKMLLFADLTG